MADDTNKIRWEEKAVPLQRIFAQLNCTDISRSAIWFERLFDRAPDECPMDGLIEWHHNSSGGLQLFENSKDAGHGTLTLIVEGLRGEHARLESAGLAPDAIEPATSVSLVRLRDPDNNLVVLAQPGSV